MKKYEVAVFINGSMRRCIMGGHKFTYEGYNFIVHRQPFEDRRAWRVSEEKTGLAVMEYGATKKLAQEIAIKRIEANRDLLDVNINKFPGVSNLPLAV